MIVSTWIVFSEEIMTPYAATRIHKSDLALLERVCHLVHELPDLDLGIDEKGERLVLSCHMLARAVAAVESKLDCYYFNGYEHSWLRTHDAHILDVYPVGMVGGPVLHCDDGWMAPSSMLFKHDRLPDITRERIESPSFARAVEMIVAEFRRIESTS